MERNRRVVNKPTMTAKRPASWRDSHGQEHRDTRNPAVLSAFLDEHPFVKELIDRGVDARMNFIEQTAQGKKVDDPVYLWENPAVDETGAFQPLRVSVVPSSSVKDGDKSYTSIRDLLDMIYYNTAWDEENNPRGFELDDVYDYASKLMADKIFLSKDENGQEIRRPILEDYWQKHYGTNQVGGSNPNLLEQSQEWQRPTATANALTFLAPRETGMKLDPEMETMLQAGNEGNEYQAAAGDIGEAGLSLMSKPLRFLRLMATSPKWLRIGMKIAPTLTSQFVNRTPEMVKLLGAGVKKGGDKLLDLGASHPILAHTIGGGLDNAAIYSLGRGYDALTDEENYYSSVPWNLENLGLSAGIGAAVPLAVHGGSRLAPVPAPIREVIDNFETAVKPRDERVRTAFAKSMQEFDQNTGKLKPSAIPDQWVADVGSDLVPTKNWNDWLNAEMRRFESARPDMRYSMRTNPPSNIEKVADDSGVLAKQKIGKGASQTKRTVDPTTGKLGDETFLFDPSGHRTSVGRKESDKFKFPTDYSVEDWRKGLKPSQRKAMDEVNPELSKKFSTSNSVMDDPHQMMMQMPGRDAKVRVETPSEYSANQARLSSMKGDGEDVAKYRSKIVYASDPSGVPMPLSTQKEFRRVRNDRADREKGASKFIKGDNKASTPLLDLENEVKVPLWATVGNGAVNAIARTVGRNAPQGADKHEYVEEPENKRSK